MRFSGHGLFALGSAALVGAAVIAALLVIGWPQDVRLRRLDEKRAADLTRIEMGISNYWTRYGAFPEPLEDVHRFPMLPRLATSDPTDRPYEFHAIDAQHYELCATFDTRNDGLVAPPQSVSFVFNKHPAGHSCFRLEVKPVQGNAPR